MRKGVMAPDSACGIISRFKRDMRLGVSGVLTAWRVTCHQKPPPNRPPKWGGDMARTGKERQVRLPVTRQNLSNKSPQKHPFSPLFGGLLYTALHLLLERNWGYFVCLVSSQLVLLQYIANPEKR
jgi:hypothetical protein